MMRQRCYVVERSISDVFNHAGIVDLGLLSLAFVCKLREIVIHRNGYNIGTPGGMV
jgi:hypothetical protein